MPRIWFITGSSRGLGHAITKAALEAGDSVIATARKPEQLSEFVDQYGSSRVLPVALDVSDNDQVIKAVETGYQKFGRIDVVVNNAGYANTASLEDIDIGDFRAQLSTNFLGVVYVTKATLPILREQGSGHIFQVSSLGGRLGTPGLTAYQASKWAVGGLTTGLAQEAGHFGVKFTVLEPGGMPTDWSGSSMEIREISEPYQASVGAFVGLREKLAGNGPSKPPKVAQIVLKLLDEKEPPLRLLIGPDAVEYASKAAEALADSDKKWRELSLSSA